MCHYSGRPLVCEDIQADVEDGQLQFFYVLAFVLQGDVWKALEGLTSRICRDLCRFPLGLRSRLRSCGSRLLPPVWVLVFLGRKCSQASKEEGRRVVQQEQRVPTSWQLLTLPGSAHGPRPVRPVLASRRQTRDGGRAGAFPSVRVCLPGHV